MALLLLLACQLAVVSYHVLNDDASCRWVSSDGNESQHSLMTAIFDATAASTKAVAEVASFTAVTLLQPVTLSLVQSVLFHSNEPRRVLCQCQWPYFSQVSLLATVASVTVASDDVITAAALSALAWHLTSESHLAAVPAIALIAAPSVLSGSGIKESELPLRTPASIATVAHATDVSAGASALSLSTSIVPSLWGFMMASRLLKI